MAPTRVTSSESEMVINNDVIAINELAFVRQLVDIVTSINAVNLTIKAPW